MKRSKSLSLLLMGSMVLGTGGCGSENTSEGMYTFTSLDECVSSGIFDEAECREFARGALAETPRFNSLADCEAQFGQGACQGAGSDKNANRPGDGSGSGGTEVRPHSGSYWMPMMMGFMAGRFMGGGGMMQGSQGLYRDPAASPQQGGRSFRTAGGETVKADGKGRVTNPSPRMTQSMSHNAKPATGRAGSGSRGGFSGGSSYGGGAS
ncbi:DUF1190 domain-containing protein [Desulfovibrio sp. OttesenSCG-928-A18]|nr:DUF1190 domain-containing protein [Desulfovibrio sp. OttesenSCG-928-A18]